MKKTILLISLSILTIGIQARTRSVRVSGGDYTTVGAAVAACSDGDVVDVLGDFTETAVIQITKSITIQGAGTSTSSITRSNAASSTRLFNASTAGKSLVIKDLTLKQAAYTGSDVGMALRCSGPTSTLLVDNVVFNGFNSGVANAGALWADNLGSCTITNCEFVNNTTTMAGGAIMVMGTTAGTGVNKTIIERCTFEGNNASSANSGHAILLNNIEENASLDSVLINNCTFYNNGAIANVGSTIRLQYHGARIGIKNCTFANNNQLSTSGDIFTNTVTNSIASKLWLIGNLFYKSGGLLVSGETATSGTHTKWTGQTYYNSSTGSLAAGTNMTVAGNLNSLTADATGGLQLDYNIATGMANLVNNGGKVRTIKLLGASNAENTAINRIPVAYKQNTSDARGYTRKSTTTDLGACEAVAVRTVRVAGGDYTSVSAAVADCNDGDVVDVLGNLTETATISVTKSITIQGGTTANTSITRSNSINSLRLINASTAGKSLSIKNLTLKQEAYTGTDLGMGIHCAGATSSLTVDNVIFNGFNSGSLNAGALSADNLGSCSISNSEFINNTNTSIGAAICISGSSSGTGNNTTTINRCTFEGNSASSANSGHAIVLNNLEATASTDSILINNCTFFNNGATPNVGSTIRLQYHGARIGIKNCTFANNNQVSTAGDIFTNTYIHSVASKLYVIGNLFYKSGGFIVSNGTATSGTHTQWTGCNYYNFSTGAMTEGTHMTKVGNAANLTADVSGGLQVDYNVGTGVANLTNNGGIVRTIKLLGADNNENRAVSGIPELYKQNSLDACELIRKSGASDAGAYETNGGGRCNSSFQFSG